MIRGAAWSLIAAGAVIAIFALGGPWAGLGYREDFVIFAWLGIPRHSVLFAGILLGTVGASALACIRLRSLDARGRRAMLGNGALFVSSCLTGLLLLEIAIRSMDGVPVFAARNWLAERNALLTTQTVNEYHPILGWVLRPGLRSGTEDSDSSFTTGPHGIRLNSPNAVPPPRGSILASGDSFTAGSEVGDRHSWPAHLERMLGQPVANAATGGWGTDQIVLRAEELIPILQPKVVIVSYLDDDVRRSAFRVYGSSNKPYFTIDQGALAHHNNPVPVYTGKPSESARVMLLLGYSYLIVWLTDRLDLASWWRIFDLGYVETDNDPVTVSCKLLERLKRATDTRGIRLIFVMQHPGNLRHSDPDVQPKPYAVDVIECARRARIETVDLWPDLVAVHRRSLEEYKGLFASFDGRRIFGHMSSAGNRLVAERIAAQLRTRLQ